MRVLVVTNDFPPRVGGINDYVAQLVGRLPSGSVTVFSSTAGDAARFDATFPQTVVRAATAMLLPTPAVIARVSHLVEEMRPDVILFGAALPLAFMGATLRARHGVPYVACTHGFELAATRLPGGRAFLGRLGRTAAAVTVVSRFVGDRLRPHLGTGCEMPLLPSGVDVARFHPGVDVGDVRARHALGSGPVVACVSRLVPRKGQETLVQACRLLSREWPDLRLLVVGGGPYERALRRLVARTGTGDHVVFAGEVGYDALPAYFRVGDVFAMPCRSRWAGLEVEGLGAVFLQAAAVGRPCLAGDSGGAPEAVRHDETGLVVNGRHPAEVAAALRRLLTDTARADAMGAAGAAWMHAEWSWAVMAERLRGILERAADAR